MRNPDDAYAYGLTRQIESLDLEIERVQQHLTYLRASKAATIERLRVERARTDR
jgi:hypothetical protein